MDSFSDARCLTLKSRPLSDVLHVFILLLIGKFLKTLTVFITYDLLKSYHLIFILFLTTLIASVVLVFVQKPFSSSSSLRLNRTLLSRLIRYAIGLTLIRLLWLFGLSLCGPLRTILLFEHSDLVVLACGYIVFSSSNPVAGQQHGQTARIRGVVFFILAILAILAFDNDDANQQVRSLFAQLNDIPDLLSCRHWIILKATRITGSLHISSIESPRCLALLIIRVASFYYSLPCCSVARSTLPARNSSSMSADRKSSTLSACVSPRCV